MRVKCLHTASEKVLIISTLEFMSRTGRKVLMQEALRHGFPGYFSSRPSNYLATIDMRSEQEDMSNSSFLLLPVEIRLEMLRYLLLAPRLPCLPSPRKLKATMLSVLLVNRQIYKEARDIFFSENSFARIVTNYNHLYEDLETLGIFCVTPGRKAKDFYHHSLKMLLIFHSYKPIGVHSMLLFAEDLHRFCDVARILTPWREHVLTVRLEFTMPVPWLETSRMAVTSVGQFMVDLWLPPRVLMDLTALKNSVEFVQTIDSKEVSEIEVNFPNMVSQDAERIVETIRENYDGGMKSMREDDHFGALLVLVIASRLCLTLLERPNARIATGYAAGLTTHEYCVKVGFRAFRQLAQAHKELGYFDAPCFAAYQALAFAISMSQQGFPFLVNEFLEGVHFFTVSFEQEKQRRERGVESRPQIWAPPIEIKRAVATINISIP